MFSNLLLKSIKVGEKAFHILCDVSLNLDEYEKLGVEIIKDAKDCMEAKKKMDEDKAKLDAEKAQAPIENPSDVKPAE